MGRCALARSRSSAAHKDTPRHADARSIRVHTEEHNQAEINNLAPPAGLGSRMVPGLGTRVVGHQGAGIQSRRRRRRSRAGAGVKVVQRRRCSTLTPAPALLRDEPADATGYPLPPRTSCGQDNQHRAVRVLLRAVNSGHLRRTKAPATRRSAGITWHGRQIPKLTMHPAQPRQIGLERP